MRVIRLLPLRSDSRNGKSLGLVKALPVSKIWLMTNVSARVSYDVSLGPDLEKRIIIRQKKWSFDNHKNFSPT